MRIALILSGNILKSPYVMSYTKTLDKHGVKYDIISWNRLGIHENSLQFNLKAEEGPGYLKRYLDYYRYIRFVKSQLRKNDYQKIVIFTIALGVILLPFLKRKYNGKYIFDIRDRSIVGNILKGKVEDLINHSSFTVISSPGFNSWLPKDKDYIMCHNCTYDLTFKRADIKLEDEILQIYTIGSIRDYEANSVLINEFGNHSGYKLKFIGSGPHLNALKNLVKVKDYDNITFTGRYNKEDELNLLKDAHFINLLINLTINSKTCIGNRVYLAAITGIPLLVDANTYQAELLKKFKLGCIVDIEKPLDNQIKMYIKHFDIEAFEKGRQEFLELVFNENKLFEHKLIEFFKAS